MQKDCHAHGETLAIHAVRQRQVAMSCRDSFAAVAPGVQELDGFTILKRSTMPRSRSLDDLLKASQANSESSDDEFFDDDFDASACIRQPRGASLLSFKHRNLTIDIPDPASASPPNLLCATMVRGSSDPLPDAVKGCAQPLSPTNMMSPCTSSLLDSMHCELMSPCISIKSNNHNLWARPAKIEGNEGNIWIKLELKHSIQTLLDSCGNGKLSWFYVAVRLDLANALGVNPRHLKLISLEQTTCETDQDLVIVQVILSQPPNSALSLTNVGDALHKQATSRARRAEKLEGQKDRFPCDLPSSPSSASLCTSIAASMAETCHGEAHSDAFSHARSDDSLLTATKPLPGFVGTRLGAEVFRTTSRRATGASLASRKRVVNLLQLVERVEVKAAGPVTRSSRNWRTCLYMALFLTLTASCTYLASAFGTLSIPLRSLDASSAARSFTPSALTAPRLGHDSLADGQRLQVASRANGRGARGGSSGLTQLRMLEPMTMATMILMGASKLSKRIINMEPESSWDEDRETTTILQHGSKRSGAKMSRGQRRDLRRALGGQNEQDASGDSHVKPSCSSQLSLDRLSAATMASVSAAAELAKRRAKTETRIALKRVKTIRLEDDPQILNKATETLEKLDDELSVESMVVEDTMESIIDTMDRVRA
mmetsp:Transcript_89359/g.130728  ORF Transcript_89359/g.130728 Transcript_89359/m.130728 type:complete len:657 (-) Transcript_89359:10-1980(-)